MLAFELIPDALEKKGIELAMSQAEYETLEKNEKTILASIMMQQDGSISNREMIARASDKYKVYLQTVRTARERMLTYKAQINGLETAFEWYRSSNANERGKVTSLQLSQVHPVILNFHNCIFNLRQFHNIRVESKIVKGKKHTTYFYEGRKFVPMPREKIRYYTKEEMIECWNASQRKDAPNAEAYLKTL